MRSWRPPGRQRQSIGHAACCQDWSAPRSGRGGRRFKSCHSAQYLAHSRNLSGQIFGQIALVTVLRPKLHATHEEGQAHARSYRGRTRRARASATLLPRLWHKPDPGWRGQHGHAVGSRSFVGGDRSTSRRPGGHACRARADRGRGDGQALQVGGSTSSWTTPARAGSRACATASSVSHYRNGQAKLSS